MFFRKENRERRVLVIGAYTSPDCSGILFGFFHNQKDKAESGKKLQIIFIVKRLKFSKIVIFA